MANIKFEGDTENFSEPQLKLIRSILEERGFSNNVAIIEAVGKKGDNFASYVKRIIVKTNENTFKMIAKVAPKIDTFRKAMNIEMMFQNEIFMYNVVLKKYIEIMDFEKVAINRRIKIPVCYGFLGEPPNEIIILEDLQDYILLDKERPLNDSTLRHALNVLAMFHALAYVVRYNNPEEFSRIKNGVMLLKSELDMLEESKFWMLKLEEDLLELMDEDKYKNVIDGSIRQLKQIAEKALRYDFDSQYSVIQQGDYYTNNILFKFKNKNITEAVMIDFQTSRTASPASDLLYFFLSCTDYKARRRHFNEWINYYHSELETCLKLFGLNVKEVYPRQLLSIDLKRHGKLALISSLMVVNAIIVKSGNEVADFKDRTDLADVDAEQIAESGRVKYLSEETREKLKRRVKECVDTLLELDYV